VLFYALFIAEHFSPLASMLGGMDKKC